MGLTCLISFPCLAPLPYRPKRFHLSTERDNHAFLGLLAFLHQEFQGTNTFQYYTLPILHSFNFQSYTLPILHSSNLTLFQYYTLPILHSSNLTLFQSYTLSILHSSNSTFFHYYTLPLLYSPNITLFNLTF